MSTTQFSIDQSELTALRAMPGWRSGPPAPEPPPMTEFQRANFNRRRAEAHQRYVRDNPIPHTIYRGNRLVTSGFWSWRIWCKVHSLLYYTLSGTIRRAQKRAEREGRQYRGTEPFSRLSLSYYIYTLGGFHAGCDLERRRYEDWCRANQLDY